MIQHLTIQNYALIDKVDIDFSLGLSVITGETGAGKSILLGALGLIVGQRADTQVLRDKTKKCITEATFSIADYELKDFFTEKDLDYLAISTIRREINPEGKSRAFINDTPVSLSILKEFGAKLIDIHSQHETLTLTDSSFQLSVIDCYARHTKQLLEYQVNFKEYKKNEKQLAELIEQEKQAKKDFDYIQFQYNELEEANLKPGEQEQLEEELETLNNAETIKQALAEASLTINGGEANLLSSLSSIRSAISGIGKYNSSLQQLAERLNSSFIELKDIANELETCGQEIVNDPQRIQEAGDRLDFIYHLQSKHQVKSIQELFEIKDSLSNKLAEFSSLEDKIAEITKENNKLLEGLKKTALVISNNRKKTIPKIEEDVQALLSQLAMPHARIKIDHIISNELNAKGIDQIQFLFSANKGNDFKEISKVASGGELSRLMLTIKSLIARLTALPTIIFDEIDTGVSGEVAAKTGSILKGMAVSMQVISITHLPQIASKGDNHFVVYKKDDKEHTTTYIQQLTEKERIKEIAKMLSSGMPTETAIKNAKELLGV